MMRLPDAILVRVEWGGKSLVLEATSIADASYLAQAAYSILRGIEAPLSIFRIISNGRVYSCKLEGPWGRIQILPVEKISELTMRKKRV